MCKTTTAKPARRTQGMNWIRKAKRLAIYLRDGMACVYCGRGVEDGAQLTLDHIECYSAGGSNDESNLVTCCMECNRYRSDRPLHEWLAAVSSYVNHGVTVKAIYAHVTSCLARPLDLGAAKALINRRGSWAAALKG